MKHHKKGMQEKGQEVSKEGKKPNILQNCLNSLLLSVWGAVFLSLLFKTIIKDVLHFKIQFLTFYPILMVLFLAQGLQSIEPIVNYFVRGPKAFAMSLLQILGRDAVCFGILTVHTSTFFFTITVLSWALADSIRYIYYLFPSNKLANFMR